MRGGVQRYELTILSTAKRRGQDRKAQNRIAQREFRQVSPGIPISPAKSLSDGFLAQRKQAYVKELEAKAAMMEMSRDEQFNRFSEAFRTLLEENQKLRTLLQTLSGFIGEGLGGALAKIGTDLPGPSSSHLAHGSLN